MSADKSKKGKGGQNNSLLAKRSGQSRRGLCYPWPNTDMPTRWQGDKTLAITPPHSSSGMSTRHDGAKSGWQTKSKNHAKENRNADFPKHGLDE